MKHLVIVPAYNEASKVGNVIDGIHKTVPMADVAVIDDGSWDDTGRAARRHTAIVITHPINRGLGGALGTGLAYARKYGYDGAVTIDADGQHDPKDLIPTLNLLKEGTADLVIGNRMHRDNIIPTDRLILNFLANILTFILYGVITHDSQSGFRGFNKRAIDSINIKTNRMEVSSEIFGEAKRLKLKIKEVPIHVRYTHYSRKKGQTNANAWSIFTNLVLRLAR